MPITTPGLVQGQQTIDTFVDPKTFVVPVDKNGDPIQYIYNWDASKKQWTKGAAATPAQLTGETDLDPELFTLSLPSELRRDAAGIKEFGDSFFTAKDELAAIKKDLATYSPLGVANAAKFEAANKITYNDSINAAAAAAGISNLGAKGFENLPGGFRNFQAVSDKVATVNPPSTETLTDQNARAAQAVIEKSYELEKTYAPQLAEITGKSQREQALKNIQSTLDTPEIAALRAKKLLTAAEKAKVAEFDSQFEGMSAAELAAYGDAEFNLQTQKGKAAQFKSLLPQYNAEYLKQLPGAKETLSSLSKLGQQMAQQANARPELTAFEQQVEGPTYGQELGSVARPEAGKLLNAVEGPMYGQELGQVQGPVTGQYLNQVAGPSVDLTLGGMQAYRPGEFTSDIAGPELQSKLGNIDQRIVDQYMSTMPGVTEGAQRLGQQINLDLAAGRSLTPEQERMATQAARQAYADRGIALGPQAITSEVLGREELAERRYRERQAAAQQAMGTISGLYQPALGQAYARQVGAEQYGLGAQAQAFGQGMSREDLARTAQAQEYQQRFGLEQLGLGAQSQQYQQALGREQLGLTTQGQQFGQAATREQQQAAIQSQKYQQASGKEQLGLSTQAQQFGQASTREQQQAAIQSQLFSQSLARGEAESARIQSANTLQSNAAGIASSVLGTQQQALSPVLSAYYNVPPSQGTLQTSVNQAQNQYSQAGINVGNIMNPAITSMTQLPYQTAFSNTASRLNFAAGYAQGR